jgi:ribosomal-protein-alanine N-acetyltransferase
MTGREGFDFGAFPELVTQRLLLRDLSPEDAPDVFLYRGDHAVQIFNAKTQDSVAQSVAFIEELRLLYRAKQEIVWALVLRESGRVIGDVSLSGWERYHCYADLGYELARDCWGRGLAREGVGAVLQFGFELMALRRVQASTVVQNTRSVQLLHRLGFQREGTRRQLSLEDDGSYSDSAMFGLLKAEWSS